MKRTQACRPYFSFFIAVDADIFIVRMREWEIARSHRSALPLLQSRVKPLIHDRVSELRGGTAGIEGRCPEHMSGSPAEITDRLAASGVGHAYIDGGITVQRFLQARLIQRLIVTRVPVLIGEGIPLFGSLPHDVQLRHVFTKAYPSGMVKSEYEVLS